MRSSSCKHDIIYVVNILNHTKLDNIVDIFVAAIPTIGTTLSLRQFMASFTTCDLFDEASEDDPNISDVPLVEEDKVDTEEAVTELLDTDFYSDIVDDDWDVADDSALSAGPAVGVSKSELVEIEAPWTTYNESKSSELQLDAAADLYSGRSGRAESARAFAASPLGLFYYFLPKLMWIKIADDTNRYRSSVLDSVVRQRQERQQRWQ